MADTSPDPQNIPTLPPDDPHATAFLPNSAPATDHVHIPGYDILGELGRGGMGVVYKARQRGLNRLVALKMILAGAHASPDERKRFRTEAEAVARLHHPNIVQIHEVGEHGEQQYFSLEFVDGGSLAQHINGTPMPLEETAELMRTLAAAIHSAHEAGIVHRDLKPANILLHTEEAKDDSRVAKITDFGLAKRLDVQATNTQTGAIMGTPSYMAPEQAGGQTKAIGPSADIYALGAILYECLTGRPPFCANTPFDTIMQVLEREPAPVRLLNPNVDRDLETICLKCLEKKPEHRYPTAQAMADDLDRYLRGEPISIRSVNILDRLARTLDRSHLDADFHAWGNMLLMWAAIVLVTHLLLCFWIGPLHSKVYASTAYLGQFALMAVAYGWCRPRKSGHTIGGAEKRLWILCGTYALACLLLLPISSMLPSRDDPRMFYATYPFCALLTGFFFFNLGSLYWGRFYAIGLLFFLLAVVMPFHLSWASLEFGGVWTVALAAIGLHLRRRTSKLPQS